MALCKSPCVVLDGVSVGYYPGKLVLKSITVALPRGVNVVLGLNGVGKTTLLRTLAGVLKPVEGSIKFYGVDRGKIVDLSQESLTVEITGSSDKINAFIDLVRTFGIKEVARTGLTALMRGPKVLKSKKS
ncbi:MAG TPA: acetolactate synthase small subunit [Pyrodictiaceae archaeon]|nr:acetolactate synthase small subunit [Pyrodictiaceae archaeon]